jgi:hypothetical protein
MLSNLLQSLRGKTDESWYDKCRRPRNRFERRARLSVEHLDGRIVPSTFVVNNPFDSGPGTLRQAILDSNQGGDLNVIEIDAFAFGDSTITLRNALPDITHQVTITGITGSGDNVVIMRDQGAAPFRIFTMYPNGEVFTLQNLTLTGGMATADDHFGDGGGIWSNGILILQHCTVARNTAEHDGGGIYQGMASLRLEMGADISANVAAHNGGGVYFESQSQNLTIASSIIDKNRATNDGGGVYYYSLGVVNITNTKITDNAALEGKGGGICCDLVGELSITDDGPPFSSGIIQNSAGTVGGGLYAHGYTITVDTWIVGNSAGDPATPGYLIVVFPGGTASVNLAKAIDAGLIIVGG